jgi:hypothetical protein
VREKENETKNSSHVKGLRRENEKKAQNKVFEWLAGWLVVEERRREKNCSFVIDEMDIG